MPELEIRDKNGELLKEGDLVIGRMSFMGSYRRKGFPETVRVILRIHWNKFTGAYELEPVEDHPEDHEFRQWYQENGPYGSGYRAYDYELSVELNRNKAGCYLHGSYRDDMRCGCLEKYRPETKS